MPYHDYEFNNKKNGTLDDRLTLNFLNPDYVRFEKRRVYVVEGNLARASATPIASAVGSSRRTAGFRSWRKTSTAAAICGAWAISSDYQYDSQCYERHTQVFMDLPSGGYVSNFITIDRMEPDHSIPYMNADQFTPANLRRSANR